MVNKFKCVQKMTIFFNGEFLSIFIIQSLSSFFSLSFNQLSCDILFDVSNLNSKFKIEFKIKYKIEFSVSNRENVFKLRVKFMQNDL